MAGANPWVELGRAVKDSALERLGLPPLKLYGLLLIRNRNNSVRHW
jgi:hypothetical protein